MPRDDAYLLDILDAAGDILAFTQGMDLQSFQEDAKTQAAVQHKLVVIGEAVRRLSGRLRAAHATVPWHEIAGMRNRLVHEYERVDLAEVWNVVARDIPELIDAIRPLLPDGQP